MSLHSGDVMLSIKQTHELTVPIAVNSTNILLPLIVTPSLIRCTEHVLGESTNKCTFQSKSKPKFIT